MKEFTDLFSSNWILIAIFGNFLIALSNVISKVIVSGSVSKKPVQPTTYTFYSGFFGIFVFLPALVLNIWFNFVNLNLFSAGIGLIGGMFIVLSLWPFYHVLTNNETSRVMTLFVGAVPFFTFVFKYIFIGERLKNLQLLAIVFLIIGGILVSMKRREMSGLNLKDAALTVLSGLGIALGLIFAEQTFKLQGFISGFIWITGGYFLSSIILYFWPGQRIKIMNIGQYSGKKNIILFFSEKILGTSGSTVIQYAISLISATFVNALDGLRQFFVLILVGILSFKYPQILGEESKEFVLWQKILAAILIFIGIFLLI